MTQARQRQHQLQQQLRAQGLDALALLPGPSLFYLSGVAFHLMERPIIGLFAADSEPALVLPSFEASKAGTSELDFNGFTYSEDPASYAAACRAAIEALQLTSSTIGVEPLSMRYQEAELLRAAAPEAELVPGDGVTGRLRATKDGLEIEAMRRAVQVAQSAMEATLTKVKPGITERELASELTVELLRAGSEPELPFGPIVASGPNSALPHASASERRLAPGELLLIDWGARVDGYCSDLSRVFALGEVDEELARVHEVVLEANRAARAAVAPRTRAGEIDRAARAVIEAAGYGEQFIHRTGHGLGLEAHEPPYIRAGGETELEPGMTFTIEPGVYLEGRGGVRIEDNVVVSNDGGKSLSDQPRGLRRLS